MSLIESIGILAAILTTSSFFPQVIKIWKSRSTADLSFPMYLMMLSGTLLWLVYGILLKNLPLILANSISAILSFIILFLKIINNLKKERKPNL